MRWPRPTNRPSAVTELNQRAAQLRARGELVKSQVEQLILAFQFQDRGHQILDQVSGWISIAMTRLRGALAEGRAPGAAEWQALMSAGYTTVEQYRSTARSAPAAAAGTSTETTFF